MSRKLIELLIEEDQNAWGVEAISLVKFPAIEENFVFFNKGGNTRAMSLAQLDEDKRTLIGAALIPDKNIPRYDEDTDEEYDVFFSKDTVKLASELYLKQNRTNDHTLEHATKIEDVSVVESWIVENPEMDKSNHYNMSVPEGTWMVRVRVDNDEVWSQVKAGSVRGLSIEGYFVDKVAELSERKKPTDLKQALKKVWAAVKRKFYQEITLETGVIIATEDDSFEAGVAIFALDSEGLPVDLKAGRYRTKAGVDFEVFEGILTEWDGEVKAVEDAAEDVVEADLGKVELDDMKVRYYKALLKGRLQNYSINTK